MGKFILKSERLKALILSAALIASFLSILTSYRTSLLHAVKNLFVNIVSAIMGIIASFLLNKMSTAYCMIILGTIFTIMYILMGKYMKVRVGLKPEEYSKQERKYDELKSN